MLRQNRRCCSGPVTHRNIPPEIHWLELNGACNFRGGTSNTPRPQFLGQPHAANRSERLDAGRISTAGTSMEGTMPRRPCLGSPLHPAGHTLTDGTSRCPDCARHVEAERTRGKRSRRPYTHAERQRRADTVRTWVQAHGWWCPGWHADPHPSQDLTADHITEVGSGGSEQGPLAVLCRSCNSRKQANTHIRKTENPS